MAIEWRTATSGGNGEVGVDWHATNNAGNVTYAPTVHVWAKWASEDPYVPYTWNLKVGGTVITSGGFTAEWYIGNGGTVQIDSFDNRTVNKATTAQTITLTLTFAEGYIWNDTYINGSFTWTYTVPALASYSVSYNANGGSGAPSTQKKWYDKTLALSSNKPTRTGYTFQGWATSASGSVAYAAGASYTSNAAVTLYAVWKANTWTVNYNANGGAGAPASQTKTYGKTLTLSSTKPTRTNYNFKGWGTSAASTTIAYAAGASYTANAGVTLYAVWELAYLKPRITGLRVERCDQAGALSETGAYAKASFGWATDKTVTSVNVEHKATASTTWTATTVTATGTSGNVADFVIGAGALSAETTYDVRVTVADGNGSSTSSAQVAPMSFSIDFKAGGNGVAFGKPASREGRIDSAWPPTFAQSLIGGELISSNADLNSLKTPGNYGCGNSVAATLANSPTTIGFRLEIGYAYGDNAYIYQLATRASDGRFYHRRCYVADGTWTAWRQFASVLDIYPVGAVYISYTSTSPASLFGGTWTAITGRFPYFNAGTGTGGSNTHALTVAQMPKNYASFTIRTVEGSNVIVASSGATVTNVSGDYSYVIVHATSGGDARKYTFTGSGSAHNNMPAYQTFYAWRRTA